VEPVRRDGRRGTGARSGRKARGGAPTQEARLRLADDRPEAIPSAPAGCPTALHPIPAKLIPGPPNDQNPGNPRGPKEQADLDRTFKTSQRNRSPRPASRGRQKIAVYFKRPGG